MTGEIPIPYGDNTASPEWTDVTMNLKFLQDHLRSWQRVAQFPTDIHDAGQQKSLVIMYAPILREDLSITPELQLAQRIAFFGPGAVLILENGERVPMVLGGAVVVDGEIQETVINIVPTREAACATEPGKPANPDGDIEVSVVVVLKPGATVIYPLEGSDTGVAMQYDEAVAVPLSYDVLAKVRF